MVAKRVFRGMGSLTVRTGLWFMAFCLCLATVFVVIPIASTVFTLSVATPKIKSIIKKGKEWLRI